MRLPNLGWAVRCAPAPGDAAGSSPTLSLDAFTLFEIAAGGILTGVAAGTYTVTAPDDRL